jgi:hypothetical protein
MGEFTASPRSCHLAAKVKAWLDKPEHGDLVKSIKGQNQLLAQPEA